MSAAEKPEKKELNYAKWVRKLIFQRPEMSLEDFQKAHEKAGLNVPKDKQALYQQKGVVCKRWGIKSLEELPRNRDDSLNMSGMIRLYLKKFGVETPYKKVVEYFAADELKLADGTYYPVRKAFMENNSPDPNQNKGPRAGKSEPDPSVVKKGRPKGSRNKLSDDQFLKMLKSARDFVRVVGGIGPARKVLDVLEECQVL